MSAITHFKKNLLFAILFLVSLLTILVFSGVKGLIKDQTMISLVSPTLNTISKTAWENLSTKKIIFGHQSVGSNIIQGMEDVLKENPRIKINIIANSRPWEVRTSSFVHFQVGENTQPQTKINDFVRVVATTVHHGKLDLAFFKFCYVDIDSNTNVIEIFTQYKQAMNQLSQDFPSTTFVYITVPLTSDASGIKRWVKSVKNTFQRFRNKSNANYSANFYRNQFNELLKQEYQGKAPIFDLAQIESTYPNGQQRTSVANGQQYFSLVPEYTDDGGHLNQLGRRIVAEKLIIFLAQLSDRG